MSPNIRIHGAHPPEQGTVIYKISHSMSLLLHQLTKEVHFRDKKKLIKGSQLLLFIKIVCSSRLQFSPILKAPNKLCVLLNS